MTRKQAWIERAKAWCREHYEQGADVMVECWDTAEYDRLYAEAGNAKEAWRVLKAVASVHEEREADAAYYARGERD